MTGPEVLRQDRRAASAARRDAVPRALMVGAAVVLGSRAGSLGALTGLAVALGALVVLHRGLSKVGVTLEEDGPTHRRLRGTRHWTWDEVGSVLHAERVRTGSGQPEITWVVARGTRGRRLFQASSATWSAAMLATLVTRLGEHAPVEHEPGPSLLRHLARRHRGAFTLGQIHPAAASVLYTVVGVAIVVAGSYYAYEWFAPGDPR